MSQEFQTGCPCELLYADDLVIIAETKDELLYKLDLCKKRSQAFRVNMRKTKVMIWSKSLNHNFVVCRKGVGSDSSFSDGCQSWIHKKCFKGRLKPDPKYACKRCMGLCRPVDDRSENYVTLEGIQLAVVESFCCLVDEISPVGDCELATIARTRAAWGKFRELLSLLTSTTISLKIIW